MAEAIDYEQAQLLLENTETVEVRDTGDIRAGEESRSIPGEDAVRFLDSIEDEELPDYADWDVSSFETEQVDENMRNYEVNFEAQVDEEEARRMLEEGQYDAFAGGFIGTMIMRAGHSFAGLLGGKEEAIDSNIETEKRTIREASSYTVEGTIDEATYQNLIHT